MPETKPEAEIVLGAPRLRAYDEIQFAHDLLDCVAEDPEMRQLIAPLDPESDLKSLIAARDALCWVLQHGNPDFEDNLTRLVALSLQAGYGPRMIIVRHPPRQKEEKPS